MKVSLLALVLLSFSLVSFSQTPVLSGSIRDAENKQPLSGATVKLVRGTDSLTVVSDKTGTFEFNNLVDTGKYNLVISFLGYELTKREIVCYDTKTTYLNIVFLLFISLIPFTTAFIGQNPHSFVAIAAYGLVLMFASATAIWMYSHLAFKSNLLLPEVSERSKKRVYRQIASSPFVYMAAIAGGLITTYLPIAIYIIMPVIFMFMPQLDFDTKEEEIKKQHQE